MDVLGGEERYALHPLTRAFVRDELLADANFARETGMRFARYWADYAERYGGDDNESYKTYDRLEAEWTNLDATANWLWKTANVQGDSVGDKDSARKLNNVVNALWNFLWFSGRWDEWGRLSSWAYGTTRATRDWSNAGKHAYHVFWACFECAHTNDAARWADQCAEAWAHGGSKFDQATATRMRGLIARQRKDYHEAEQLLQEALSVRRDLKLDRDVALVLEDLGELAYERKSYAVAEQYYRESLELAQKIKDKEHQAECNGGLGLLALNREQREEASKWFEQELALAKKVGRVELIAKAKYGLARVHEAERRADLALPLAQEALKIYERLQHKDLAEVREFCQRIGNGPPPPPAGAA